MLFEDLDKKIKEAADQHHPAYDEKAWQKMEKLLSDHLPQQKDDRRRIIFFIFLALLVGGGTYLTIAKPWSKKSGTDQVAQDKIINATAAIDNEPNTEKTIPNKQGSDKTNQVATKSNNNNVVTDKTTIPGANGLSSSVNTRKPDNNQERKEQGIQRIPGREISLNDNGTQNKNNGIQNDKSAIEDLNKQPDQKIAATETKKPNPDVNQVTDNSNANKVTNNVVGTETKTNKDQPTQATAAKKTTPLKKSFKNNNGISFLISAGPDVSKAGGSRTGKTTIAYGAGIGYTRNRITLRTGVYTAKKIYWAGSKDYKLSFVPVPPSKFIGADANCDVIEIPVKFSYSFANKKLSNWFAGAGLSTYLMKRETYIYNYKNYLGTSSFVYETKNESKHYFSILNLSAGYTRKINNAISITAEPYAEFPLTGIGIGKVHLNSGGILFTVGLHPFKK